MPLTRRRHMETQLASIPTDIYAEFVAGWDRLEIHGQDIHAVATGEAVATEALVRWRRGPGELWAAAMALPIAEETGVIDVCTHRALEMSIAAWAGSTRRSRTGRLSLNLHRTRLESNGLVGDLHRMCTAYGVQPSELLFEIPDRLGPEGCRVAVDVLMPLFDAGAQLVLDDHRGEASETTPHPTWLPIGSMVKLDAAITDVCDHHLGREILARTTEDLQAKGYEVVAEMIERPEQLDAAKACGVTFAQGHLFGMPRLLT